MMATKDPQQFCVRWNSYQTNLQSAFPKLLSSEHFVDVTLACESQMVKCHKVVLSACSAYFEKLLVENPCQHPIIFMKDMKFWEVQALVDFMYKGEVNVTQEELGTLLKAAEALEVRGLCGQHEQGLAEKLSLPSGEGEKKRRLEAEVREEHVITPQPPPKPSEQPPPPVITKSSPPTPKSPGLMDFGKQNTPSSTTSSINVSQVKQEKHGAPETPDNGLFEDFDDDFYQDDNSLQIDETGTAYSLPGPSTQLDASPDNNTAPWNLNNGYPPNPNVILTEQNYGTPSPSGETPGKVTRIRRSDAELLSAADSICKGMTFQKASQMFNIPMSTIRFYMARKGMLPTRRRGRRISQASEMAMQHHMGSNSSSLGGSTGGASTMHSPMSTHSMHHSPQSLHSPPPHNSYSTGPHLPTQSHSLSSHLANSQHSAAPSCTIQVQNPFF